MLPHRLSAVLALYDKQPRTDRLCRFAYAADQHGQPLHAFIQHTDLLVRWFAHSRSGRRHGSYLLARCRCVPFHHTLFILPAITAFLPISSCMIHIRLYLPKNNLYIHPAIRSPMPQGILLPLVSDTSHSYRTSLLDKMHRLCTSAPAPPVCSIRTIVFG